MKFRLTTVTILMVISIQLYGQKCNSEFLIEKGKRIGRLELEEIRDMLLTYGKVCNSDIEFSELSNGLLFSLLDKQTKLTLIAIEWEEGKIEMKEIFDILSSPIHDGINIGRLIPKIEKVDIDERLKGEILGQLEIAKGKTN